MFCCTICSCMFTGVYPEVIEVTPCGHAFHMKCINMCLQKSKSKCPFCTSRINKNKLTRLHLQIDKNWKDKVSSLTSKANSSVINLDETLNHTLRVEDSDSLNDETLVNNNPNELVIEVSDTPISRVKHLPMCIFGPKTLITTSLSSALPSSRVQDLLSIFNGIIPNSVIKTRLLITESTLVDTAPEEGFTHILIINMHLGRPIGLYLYDLYTNVKANVLFKSYECLEYKSLNHTIKAPPLAIKVNGDEVNELQEVILYFFSQICIRRYERTNEEEINVINNYSDIEFSYKLAGLNFSIMTPPGHNVGILKEIFT